MKHIELKVKGLNLVEVDGPIFASINPVGTAYAREPQIAKQKAQDLCFAWNEHDTLKAKAELFNELVEWVGYGGAIAKGLIDTVGPNPAAEIAVTEIKLLLSKAKELK